MKSKLAVASFILGLVLVVLEVFLVLSFTVSSLVILLLIVSPFVPLAMVGGIVGLVLGIVSIFAIKKHKMEGMNYAVWGIILCVIGLVGGLVLLAALAQSVGTFF